MAKIKSETKEQFIARYCGPENMDFTHGIMVVLPCDCEDGGGPTHWAAVRNTPEMIQLHLDLYAPEGTPWPEEACDG